MVESDARWVACAIDCEGCITLSKHRCKKTLCGTTWQAMVLITNTNLPFVKELQRIIGCGYIRNGTGQTRNGLPIYILYFSPSHIVGLLQQVEPALIIKKRHSELLREAMPLITAGRGHNRTPEQLRRLEDIFAEIRSLNSGKANRKKYLL